jgi:hypothetical protein
MMPDLDDLKNSVETQLNEKDRALNLLLEEKYPVLYWARKFHCNTRGEIMNFDKMPYLIHLYRDFTKMPHFVVMKSVQCGLSELFIVGHFYEAAVLGFTVFYVLPKYELRNRYVNNRIDKTVRRVPMYAKMMKEASGSTRVSLKHFGKGTIAYVGSNVEDEFVEIPVDSAYIDEKDRCNQGNLLMVPDRLTASPYKYYREISNPTVEGFGIDERYQSSTKGAWFIKCEHCNHYFSMDFFEHIVRQVDSNHWMARDTDYRYRETNANIMCPKCFKPVNRLSNGEWVHEFPKREWKGFQIGKMMNKYVGMGALVDKWMDSFIHPLKTQIFYNSDLGLPYSSVGSKITDGLLNGCQRPYAFPMEKKDCHGIVFMGIDVGSSLNIVIRERVRDEHGAWVRRLVWAGTVPSFVLVKELIKSWNPKIVVIDALPEIHEVLALKESFRQVYSSKFTQGQLQINLNRDKRIISMDRTALLDALRSEFEAELLPIPDGAEHIDGGAYYSQLKAATRILVTNETNPERSYYSWEHTVPDHYMLAEAYCLQADLMVPRDTVIDFYSSFLKEQEKPIQENLNDISNQTGKSQAELDQLMSMSPSQFLDQLGQKNKGR